MGLFCSSAADRPARNRFVHKLKRQEKMKRKTGIWIDRKKAVIVHLEGKNSRSKKIENEFDSRIEPVGRIRSKTPFGSQGIMPEGKSDRRFKHHLQKYFKQIGRNLSQTDSVFIFGPGEAKTEFMKFLRDLPEYADSVDGIGSADKMTYNQIAAKVKRHFRD